MSLSSVDSWKCKPPEKVLKNTHTRSPQKVIVWGQKTKFSHDPLIFQLHDVHFVHPIVGAEVPAVAAGAAEGVEGVVGVAAEKGRPFKSQTQMIREFHLKFRYSSKGYPKKHRYPNSSNSFQLPAISNAIG